jgi:phosphoesterase RecJ-like protein
LGRILAAVRAHQTFLLTGHEKPDGDTVGSELAMASFLRRLGKKVDIVNHDPVPRLYHFLPGVKAIRADRRVVKNYDVVVVFECSGPDRMGRIINLDTQAKVVINIDHHAHHNHFGHINLIDPSASSNSEQLFDLFGLAGLPVTKAEAAALYVGLVTDTGRFQQNNTTPQSHRVAAELHGAGVNVAEICRRLYNSRTPAALALLSRALAGLRLADGGRISVLSLTRQDLRAARAHWDDTEEIVNYGLMPPSVEASIFLRETETPGRLKGSLRGKGAVDLCTIAVGLGGGGHRNAAGFSLDTTIQDAARRLVGLVRKALPK